MGVDSLGGDGKWAKLVRRVPKTGSPSENSSVVRTPLIPGIALFVSTYGTLVFQVSGVYIFYYSTITSTTATIFYLIGFIGRLFSLFFSLSGRAPQFLFYFLKERVFTQHTIRPL